MLRRLVVALCLTFSGPALAVEIDFGTRLLDLDGKPYRDCARMNEQKTECAEWIEHTLGLVAYGALDRPEQGPDGRPINLSVVEQVRRSILAQKVYPKLPKHVVDVTSAEITLIIDQVAKVGLRPVELMRVIEILDPARLKAQ